MEKLIETHVTKPEISYTDKATEQNLRAITLEDELFLDSKIMQLETFITNNHGLGKSEVEKDQLYFSAQTSWREYVSRLKNMKYTFYLNRKEYNFLTNLLLTKLEYTVDTVFIAVELTNMLGEWELTKGKNDVKTDAEIKAYVADATEITYMYHLIAKHTVKGLTNDTYLFVEILKKIGFISKIVSYYDNNAKSFNKDIQDWVSTFEEGIFVEGKSWGRKEYEELMKSRSSETQTTEEIKVKKTSKKKEASSTNGTEFEF
jgi:hypothetical protein